MVFRLQFWSFLAFLTPVYAAVLFSVVRGRAPWYQTGLMGLVAAAIAAGILYLLNPYRVSRSYLRATTFWGVPVRLHWSDITEVRPSNWFLRLPYLHVFSRHAPVMWLALFYGRRGSMELAIIENAPEDNPLRLYLESRRRGPR